MTVKRAVPVLLSLVALTLPGQVGASGPGVGGESLVISAVLCRAQIEWSVDIDSVDASGTMAGSVDVESADPASDLRWFVRITGVSDSGGSPTVVDTEPVVGSGSMNVSLVPGSYVALFQEQRSSPPGAKCTDSERETIQYVGQATEITVSWTSNFSIQPRGLGVTQGLIL